MIDKHIYDYDAYSRDTEDATYFCAESVMDIIDDYVREKSNFDLESKSMIDSLNRRALKLRASNNCISSVMSRFSDRRSNCSAALRGLSVYALSG